MTVSSSAADPDWNPPEIVLAPTTSPDGYPSTLVGATYDVTGAVTTATGYTLGPGGPGPGPSGILTVSGTLTLLPTATIDGSSAPDSMVLGGGTLINQGNITSFGVRSDAADVPLSILTIGGAPATGLLFRNDGTVTVAGNFSPHGVAMGSGAVVVTAALDPRSDGTFVIGHRGTLEIASDPNHGQTYDFQPGIGVAPYGDVAGGGMLIIDNPGTAFDEAISGFAPGSGTIVVRGIGTVGAAILDPAAHILRVYADDAATRQIYAFTDVDSDGAPGGVTSAIPAGSPDGSSAGLIDMTGAVRGEAIACFVAGTRITTPSGEAAVEALREGDLVTTRDGAARPIMWIGRRRIDLADHPEPARVRPLRILAGAFGDGLPHRDLLLSGDHAVLADGMLVPVRALVNGTTIRAETACDSIAYVHLELATHAVILAEGLPAETWRDTGNRAMFDNAAGFDAGRADWLEADRARGPAARVVARGPALTRLRARLARCAASLGHAVRAEIAIPIHVVGRMRVVIPPQIGRAVLTAASVHPAAAHPASGQPGGDRRCLGALLSGLWLDGQALPLAGPHLERDFHAPECHGGQTVCWTDGDAAITFAPADGARLLEISVAAISTSARNASLTLAAD